MTDDTSSSSATATPDLVADYLADLLRSMTSLAEAADLPQSAKALRSTLAIVSEERLVTAPPSVSQAASDC